MHVERSLRLSLALALALLVGVVSPAAAQVNNYVVGAQDILAIQVFDQADLAGKYTVEADGSISFPLIGRVKVGGLTLREVELELKKQLADGFFKNPQVSVAVEQYRSQRIFIVGEVKIPGTYPLTGDMSLIEALARAGSTTESAGGEVLIVRKKAGLLPEGPAMLSGAEPTEDANTEVIRVDVKNLQSGRLSQNAMLRDSDTIFVPRAETVYVVGQVRNPGSYPLRAGMTVLQVLSLAGGITDRGADGRIRIERLVNGERREIRVRLEEAVFPGDTVIVPERFF